MENEWIGGRQPGAEPTDHRHLAGASAVLDLRYRCLADVMATEDGTGNPNQPVHQLACPKIRPMVTGAVGARGERS